MLIDDPWDNLDDLKNRVLSGEDVASQEYVKALDMFGIKTEVKQTKWQMFKERFWNKWWAWRNSHADR